MMFGQDMNAIHIVAKPETKTNGAAHHMCWELSVATHKAQYMDKKPKPILATPIEEECR